MFGTQGVTGSNTITMGDLITITPSDNTVTSNYYSATEFLSNG